jgi:serpin B
MMIDRRKFLSAAGLLTAGAMLPRVQAMKPAENLGVATGVNPFAFDLYKQLRSHKGNVFVSPFSISCALSMTAAGAKGETLAQMAKVLHLQDNGGKVGQEKFRDLIGQTHAPQRRVRPFQLDVANAIWAQKGYPWRDEFKVAVQSAFQSDVNEADFKTQAEETRLAINKWVEERTRDKIKDLFAKGVINSLTRMVLANAVYYKGTWETPFQKAATTDAPFLLADGTKQAVPMMVQKSPAALHETDEFQLLHLPYSGKQTSMLVLLPRKADGLADLESKLTHDSWAKAVGSVRGVGDVQIHLPKFKVETQYGLNDTLAKMGMADAFDLDKADFSGMVTEMPEGKLAITAVVHKAYCDVNEEGTEAAAATGVVVGVRSAPAKPKVFKADHPFLFAIRHDPTNTILFLGRVSNPKG